MDWSKILKVVLSKQVIIPLITIIICIIITKTFSAVVTKIISKKVNGITDKRRNTIIVLLDNIIKYVLIILAVIIILSAWGVNVAGFITGLGVAGVVAGLALQDALKDIIMGCNIILDNYYVVGDYVNINGFNGEVIGFGLKNTKIKSLTGDTLVIANREITKVINYSLKNFLLQISVDVAYEESEEKVKKTLEAILDDIYEEKIVSRKGIYLGIDSFDASSIKYSISVECNPKEQYRIKRIINDRIKKSFDKNNIKIPYQQIEVHHGSNI